jgi:cell division protein ZapA
MAEVDVTVAGRRRRLACEDGEEPHLEKLAAMLDEEAKRLAPRMGPVSDAQLLLMAGIMLADRLNDATETLRAAEKALAAAQAAPAEVASSVLRPEAADGAPSQRGLFEEDEAAAALDAAAAALEAALARREGGDRDGAAG